MKNYKKGLLAAMILSAMSLMAAEDKTIYVTTFADEDGENANACSLREAIKTAKLDKAYGGCSVGRRVSVDGTAPDMIQLEAGEYKLDKELIIESEVSIYGKSSYNYTEKSPITGEYPRREALKTTISGQGKTRLFNSIESQNTINIYDLILKDAYTEKNGAAFYVAGPLNINNSEIVNAQAKGNGAAIYAVALNTERNINVNDSLIHQNNAQGYGSVLAMDCQGNLGTTQTSLNLSRSTVVNNGSSASASIFELCGYSATSLSNSTIAKNTARSDGHIISFYGTPARPLSSSASLALQSNTIVENTAKSVLYYDNIGTAAMLYNVLAYNNGLSCEYALNKGKPTLAQSVTLNNNVNAVQSSGSSRCVLPELEKDQVSTNLDITNVSMSSLLSNYLAPSLETRYLGLYYPLDNKTEKDLIDVGSDGCTELDQRSVDRMIGSTLLLNPTARNSCDIGAVESRHLTAADITDLKNTSLVDLLASYQSNIDELNDVIANKDTPASDIPSLKDELKEYENLLKYTKQYQKYRAIYIDPFKLAMPAEELSGKTIKTKLLNAKNYSVSTKSMGVGELVVNSTGVSLDGQKDPALKCTWNANLGRILMYRTDGKATSSVDSEYCSYTLKDNSSGVSSSGILEAKFGNIAPIAKDDEYIIRPENNLIVKGNPLENDSDEGDGPLSTLTVKKNQFYTDDKGQEIPIRIVKAAAGVTIKAEREGACPGSYQREKCYGGDIVFTVKNNLSQADYEMTYAIHDADELTSSNATIRLKNTVKNTNASSSGGGSMGALTLFGLLGLVAYRKKRMK